MKILDVFNERAKQEGLRVMSKCDGGYHGYLKGWLASGMFFDVVSTWWQRRNEPNVLFAHYNDMKADLIERGGHAL